MILKIAIPGKMKLKITRREPFPYIGKVIFTISAERKYYRLPSKVIRRIRSSAIWERSMRMRRRQFSSSITCVLWST